MVLMSWEQVAAVSWWYNAETMMINIIEVDHFGVVATNQLNFFNPNESA